MKRLWIDDLRTAPEGWDVARTYAEAVDMLFVTDYDVVSFDHDLGEYFTGYDIICVLEERQQEGFRVPRKMFCHSDNPPGRERIKQVIRKIMGH